MFDGLETVGLSQITGRVLSKVISGKRILVRRYNWPEVLMIRVPPRNYDEIEQTMVLLRKWLKENETADMSNSRTS